MTQPYHERPDTPTEDVPEAAPAEAAPAEDAPADTGHAGRGPDSAEDVASAVGGVDDGPTTSGGGFGDPRVDDAVARLEELPERPVGEHAEVFDDIHQQLRGALEEAAVEPADEPRG
jgi:hypothetical protein